MSFRAEIAFCNGAACKPNFVAGPKVGGNHSSGPFVAERLERPTRKRRRLSPALSGQLKKAFPYLVLHHEEFTWPRLLPDAPVSSYLTVSPITSGISNFKFEI